MGVDPPRTAMRPLLLAVVLLAAGPLASGAALAQSPQDYVGTTLANPLPPFLTEVSGMMLGAGGGDRYAVSWHAGDGATGHVTSEDLLLLTELQSRQNNRWPVWTIRAVLALQRTGAPTSILLGLCSAPGAPEAEVIVQHTLPEDRMGDVVAAWVAEARPQPRFRRVDPRAVTCPEWEEH